MVLKNFDICHISNDYGHFFMNQIYNLIERLNPPLIDLERLEIIYKKDFELECVNIYIPHKNNPKLDIRIEYNELITIVVLSEVSIYFEEYINDMDRINDTINLVSRIIQSNIEIHTYYKNNTVVKRIPYLIRNHHKEKFQVSYYHPLTLFNPFLKTIREIEKGSYFRFDSIKRSKIEYNYMF